MRKYAGDAQPYALLTPSGSSIPSKSVSASFVTNQSVRSTASTMPAGQENVGTKSHESAFATIGARAAPWQDGGRRKNDE